MLGTSRTVDALGARPEAIDKVLSKLQAPPTERGPAARGDLSWRPLGACWGLGPGLFFPLDDTHAAPAKAVCNSCGVRDRCLDHALGYREHDGIWGGLTESERRRIIRQRRRRSA